MELNSQRVTTITRATRCHIVHILYAYDLCFNNTGYRIINNLSRCTCIGSVYTNCRWRNLWISSYRKVHHRNETYQGNNNGYYNGKDRSINKEFRHDLAPFYFVAFNCSFESNLALTFTPFLTLVKPSTMIVSPGAKPALIIVSLPLVPPTSTLFCSTTPSAFTT